MMVGGMLGRHLLRRLRRRLLFVRGLLLGRLLLLLLMNAKMKEQKSKEEEAVDIAQPRCRAEPMFPPSGVFWSGGARFGVLLVGLC